jgi:hypothetical protein
MREDQRIRLLEVSERITEVAIRDADPDNWTGAGKLLGDMDQKERGDANWCRKTAVQTVALLVRVQQVLAAVPAPPGEHEKSEDELIREAERRADELLAAGRKVAES